MVMGHQALITTGTGLAPDADESQPISLNPKPLTSFAHDVDESQPISPTKRVPIPCVISKEPMFQ